MHCSGKYCTEGDPEEYYRSPESALKGTEDRSESGDVKELD